MSETTNKFFPAVRERAVWLVLNNEGGASVALAGSDVGRGEDRFHATDVGRLGQEGLGSVVVSKVSKDDFGCSTARKKGSDAYRNMAVIEPPPDPWADFRPI